MIHDHDPEWILDVRRWLQVVDKLARQKVMRGSTRSPKEKGPAETGPKGSNTQEKAMTDGFIL